MPEQKRVVRVDATIRPDQKAMLVKYGEVRGFLSLSVSLRAVLDEWKDMKQERSTEQYTPVLSE